jgi:Zn-dependent peptidase ImmA (M78 family)
MWRPPEFERRRWDELGIWPWEGGGQREAADFSAAAHRLIAAAFAVAQLAGTNAREVAAPAPPSAERAGSRPGQLARLWRRELGAGPEAPVPDLLTLLELRAGLNVALLSVPSGPAGLLIAEQGMPFLFVNAALPGAGRRLALAHVLGHHALGHDHAVCRRIEARRGERAEVAATWFALEFLAPAAGVAAWLDAHAARTRRRAADLQTMADLAAQYGISPAVALERCRAAKRLPGRTAQRLRAAVEARADEIAGRAAFAGEFTDSLTEAHQESLRGASRVGVTRVPRCMRVHLLEALEAGCIDLAGAAALLSVPEERLVAELRDHGLRTV